MFSQFFYLIGVFSFHNVLGESNSSDAEDSVKTIDLSNSLHVSDWRSSIPTAEFQKNLGNPSDDMDAFRRRLMRAKYLLAITGAGISADSGIPTFRGIKGMWRNRKINKFATPEGFEADPGSVWEFYHYRRELVAPKEPNAAHYALVKIEKWMLERKMNFTLITMNIDGLHKKAGSKNLIELHGSMFETKCTKCNDIRENFDRPICPALKGTENNFNNFSKSNITADKLPRCKLCGGLLRPNVVWYNEDLDKEINDNAWHVIDICDLAVLVGSSSMVFPGALFAPQVHHRHVPVAEFNVKQECYSDSFSHKSWSWLDESSTSEFTGDFISYFFKGKVSETLPKALDTDWVDPEPEKYRSIPEFKDEMQTKAPKSRWGSSASTPYGGSILEFRDSNPPPKGTGLNLESTFNSSSSEE